MLGKAGLVLALAVLYWGVRQWAQGGQVTSDARMDGKVVVITGANTGIGKETALDLAHRGAEVHMLCRDVERGEGARKDVEAATGRKVYLHQLDLASLASVRACAGSLATLLPRIDVLVNNAGVMATPEARTKDGHELQFGTNHLGHFLLTNLLLPLLRESQSRVVVLSSIAHKAGVMDWDDLNFESKPYDSMAVYSQSKLANVIFAKELARRENSISVYSVHPGLVKTELSRHFYDSMGPVKYYLVKLLVPFLKTSVSGAQTSIHCALEDADNLETGGYYADCALTPPAPQAEIEEDGRKLWEASLRMVSIEG